MSSAPSYCFDTSGLLDGWSRYYSIRRFPTLWNHVAALFDTGRGFWPEEVWNEIHDDDLRQWLAPLRRCEIASAVVWSEAQRIQQAHNRELNKSGITGADSFVIATAKIDELVVVSGEVWSNGLPKIPNVCAREGIECLNFVALLDRENWTF